jgi:hypothetical protein
MHFNCPCSILYLVDSNTFASLALLNRKWRRISDSSSLYAHHLCRCPSFYLARRALPGPIGLQDLHYLKQKFFSEVRRNAFDVFLRPRRTLIKLISTSMSSSTAFPQGEGFRFFFSPNGHMVLCVNSSRIVVLDLTSDSVVPHVRHELKTSRRPLSATILDSGRLLAVVSSSHQVNIYSLSSEEAKHVQVLALNAVPRALTLSPSGSVLAVAYDNEIEVYALGERIFPSERRAVQCVGVDSISFSSDETMILGSSVDCDHNDTVTISVPFGSDDAEAGLPPGEVQTRLWTTRVLFPSTVHGYSHASLLPLHAEGDGSWILGYDSRVAAFRATKINNANAGATYFVNPASSGPQELLPMVPAADGKGELVALGFQEGGVWVYGVPDRLDITPPSRLLGSHVDGAPQVAGLPALQNSSIRLRQDAYQPKVLISGHKMIEMPGISAACWVRQAHSISGRRLIAVAPGGINLPTIGEEDVPADSGRVLVLDFERSPRNGEVNEVEVEIGDAQPKILKEPDSNIDTEIELERRRTRLHRDNPPVSRAPRRHATSTDEKRPPSPVENPRNATDRGATPPIPDIPYDNMQPRSGDTLQRAATAAATHSRYRLRHSYEANTARREHRIPHESDADSWVPPPPPYTPEPNAPLPEHLRQTLLPTRTEPVQRFATAPQVQRARTTRLEDMTQAPSRALTTLQRLNTITGARLANRARRNRSNSETRPQVRRERSFLRRRRDSSGPPPVPPIQPEHRETQPQPQAPAPPGQGPRDNTFPSNRVAPTGTDHGTPAPQSPPDQDADERIADDPEWQAFAQSMQNATSGLSFHPFTISTPELHVAEPSEEDPDTAEPENPTQCSQHQDPLLPTRGMGSLHRRVSTDPTPSQSPVNDSWRRRIEEWNEDAIYQRSKKSRNRCAVM